ncbi:hypothetical protein Q765_03150 [Flavobacterium rivuli WB 3.3-2 = DSM 21788]|uniref:Uncharacterized protein n=1 Tax=Flavobacterium rivuli WB 3.3-2 = DSM 21788 TaxID=1121895 RepID=A0A0A2M5W9_9FLAO|nr:hypothetical protein [Flavobacterium rivuli]KGO88067.1 hypothetical protein Q765_03150 [Flavobacterium rivuli WB 3.3-2 = DSM 21788]
MKNEIKIIYKSLKNKMLFCEKNCKSFGIKPSTMYTNWFSGFWQIPDDKLVEIRNLLTDAVSEEQRLKNIESV